jgi:hypothetical protein
VTDTVKPDTIEHKRTMGESQVEPWLRALAREHGPIVRMSQTNLPGGRVAVIAATTIRE